MFLLAWPNPHLRMMNFLHSGKSPQIYNPLNSVQEFVHRDILCFGQMIHEW